MIGQEDDTNRRRNAQLKEKCAMVLGIQIFEPYTRLPRAVPESPKPMNTLQLGATDFIV